MAAAAAASSPDSPELACLRMIVSFALSPASRPHAPYRIAAEAEETTFSEQNRAERRREEVTRRTQSSVNGQPTPPPPVGLRGPYAYNPFAVEPLMADDVLALLEALPVPPIRYPATRELIVRWVATEFAESVVATFGDDSECIG